MLAIRMQRKGRSGHAQFRLVVQDSRFTPTSGRVVAYLGSYDPHTKVAALDKDKATQYLKNGAQPSDRAARIMKKEGVKIPDWVKLSSPGKRATRHPEKLRRNRPAEAEVPEPVKEEAAAQQTEAIENQVQESKELEATDKQSVETEEVASKSAEKTST
ncbi:30S ribosomal protein S16 [Candidatus Saccharibacteria bacterium]|nr:30S ribosomal protein S16 [Candidatus Saccharibacteria bacterium]